MGSEHDGGPRVHKRTMVLVVVVLVLLITSLAATLREPDVNVTGLTLKASSISNVKVYFEVLVDNPNLAGAKVSSIKGKAYLNSKFVGDFKRDRPVDIRAMDQTNFDVEFLPKDLAPIHWNDNNKVRIVGTVTIDGAILDWTMGFDEAKDVYVP